MIRLMQAAAILCFSSILMAGPAPAPHECTIAFIEQEPPYHLRFMNDVGELSDPVFLPEGMEVDTSMYNSLCWSPDGQHVAFASQAAANLDIYTLNVDDGVALGVTQDPADDVSPAWSPDGSRIAFLSNRDAGASSRKWDIYVHDLATGEERRLTSRSDVYRSLAWSPDGDKIAYVRKVSYYEGDEIFVVDTNTRENAQVSSLVEPRTLEGLQWTPSEDKFLFHSPGEWGEIYTLSTRGVDLVNLTAGSVAVVSEHPSWHPCEQVLFVRIDASEQIEIWKTDERGENRQRIGTVPCFPWSPRHRFAAAVLPNLIVSSYSVEDDPSGIECIVRLTIKNTGATAAAPTLAYVEGIWPDPPEGVNPIRIQEHVEVPGLHPGETSGELSVAFNRNEMYRKDVKLIRITADAKRDVCESIETDNEAETDWP